jgi:hypothetical protein
MRHCLAISPFVTSNEQALLTCTFQPAGPAIMASTIAVDYGPRFAVCDGLNCCIKHCVNQISVRLGPDGPTDEEAFEAIDDRGKIDLSSADVKLGDVCQPLLIGRGSLEVTVDDVLGRGGRSENSALGPAGSTAPVVLPIF